MEGCKNGIGNMKELQVAVDSVIEVHWVVCKVDVAEDGNLIDGVQADVY